MSREGVSLDEAIEVIRWYQYFICAKVMWAIHGKSEEEEEGCDEFPSDSNGSAKIALIAIDRSIGAWAVLQHFLTDDDKEAIKLSAFSRQFETGHGRNISQCEVIYPAGFDDTDPSR